jgi:hypothetical protein
LSTFGIAAASNVRANAVVGQGNVLNITKTHRKNIITLPPPNVQEKVGKIVVDAYEKKEEANKIEEEAVEELEGLLRQK